MDALKNIRTVDGEAVAAEHIPAAVTAGSLRYDDGATQIFDAAGTTTYVDHGQETTGEWCVDDNGRFCSFWPPTYRACYDLHWIVEKEQIVGLEFTDRGKGSSFIGRYR
jgi:hypothetical protein